MLTDEQKEGVNEVIRILRKAPPHMFDMDAVFDPAEMKNGQCGQPVCIGGWCAYHLWVATQKDWLTVHAFEKITGLSEDIAELVCFPNAALDYNPYDATADQAIKLLEILRDTGKVDWAAAMEVSDAIA